MSGRALTRHALRRWLLANGFEEVAGRRDGHRRFAHPKGVTLSVAWHGKTELSQKHVGMMLRTLAAAGFDREKVRKELLGDGQ